LRRNDVAIGYVRSRDEFWLADYR